MVSVVYWQPTGGLMVQADRLCPKVGSHLASCCIHRMNRVNSCTVLSIKASPLKIIQHASWLIVLVASRSNITGDRCQSRRGDVIGSHSSSFVNYLGRQLHQKTCPAITWPRHTGSATGEDGVGPREEGRHWKGWICTQHWLSTCVCGRQAFSVTDDFQCFDQISCVTILQSTWQPSHNDS